MQEEETKEEYIARHRKAKGTGSDTDSTDEVPVKKTVSVKERLNGIFFMLLFALFLWAILHIFGMMKGN